MNQGGRPTILVTGASGLLGFSLQREFEGDSRLLMPDLDVFDILRRRETEEWIADHRPDLVIHCAAYTAVDKAEEEPAAAFALNRDGTAAVVAGANLCGAPVVYISSDYVFDGRKGTPYTEDDPPAPQGVYAASKFAGEEVVRGLTADHLVVRTAWIFGPGRPNFVLAMARRAEAGTPVRVVDDQTGSPTYTPHLARGIRRLWKAGARGTFHVVNSGRASWFDLTRETYRLAGADPRLVSTQSTAELGRPAPRPAFSVLDNGRYSRATGATLPDWREGLADYFSLRDSW
jgi:dTDP-4-dehydrorhamnose reductase